MSHVGREPPLPPPPPPTFIQKIFVPFDSIQFLYSLLKIYLGTRVSGLLPPDICIHCYMNNFTSNILNLYHSKFPDIYATPL